MIGIPFGNKNSRSELQNLGIPHNFKKFILGWDPYISTVNTCKNPVKAMC